MFEMIFGEILRRWTKNRKM